MSEVLNDNTTPLPSEVQVQYVQLDTSFDQDLLQLFETHGVDWNQVRVIHSKGGDIHIYGKGPPKVKGISKLIRQALRNHIRKADAVSLENEFKKYGPRFTLMMLSLFFKEKGREIKSQFVEKYGSNLGVILYYITKEMIAAGARLLLKTDKDIHPSIEWQFLPSDMLCIDIVGILEFLFKKDPTQ